MLALQPNEYSFTFLSVPELKCLTDKDLLKIADILQEVTIIKALVGVID